MAYQNLLAKYTKVLEHSAVCCKKKSCRNLRSFFDLAILIIVSPYLVFFQTKKILIKCLFRNDKLNRNIWLSHNPLEVFLITRKRPSGSCTLSLLRILMIIYSIFLLPLFLLFYFFCITCTCNLSTLSIRGLYPVVLIILMMSFHLFYFASVLCRNANLYKSRLFVYFWI